MILTLDHNCIISLEENREPRASALRQLASLCQQLHYTLAVYSYLPLENPPRNGLSRSFADFQKRMTAPGIGPIETLNPAGDTGLLQWLQAEIFPTISFDFEVYLAYRCEAAGVDVHAVREANREQYFPPFSPILHDAMPLSSGTLDAETAARYRTFWEGCHRKWNNAKSDVLELGAHIWHTRDGIFVTTDMDDFHHHIDQ